MPRENSLSDSEGRSLTPEPEEGLFGVAPASPVYSTAPLPQTQQHAHAHVHGLPTLDRSKTRSRRSLHSRVSKAHPSATVPTSKWAHLPPKERLRAAVRQVMSLRRGTTFPGIGGRIGSEPGVDPRRPLADATFGHLQVDCDIEVVDYSAVRVTSKRFTNDEFIDFMDVDSPDPVKRDPWVKVRWINIGGISWDVIKPLAIRYSEWIYS